MPLYEMAGNTLIPVAERTFTELGLLERYNIQKAISSHIGAITPGVNTMVLAEEFGDWEGVNRRIDLLCLDSDARLVVVELKREGGGHMELQALRYAAMISTMRFDQAVEAHRRYLSSIGSHEDPEQRIRDHIGIGDGQGALSETVRIVLAASDFPQELTTAVLWLNKQGLDLRCVQIRPHVVDSRVLLDVQQVIPLPSTAQYQVAVREKSLEQAAARNNSGRDFTRYDLTIGDVVYTNLPKRRLIYEVIAEAIRRGVRPEAIAAAVTWREGSMFCSAPGALNETEFRAALGSRSLDRYFVVDADLLRVDGSTYAVTTQWGSRTLEAIELIKPLLPPGALIEYSPTTPVVDEVSFERWVVRRRESGSFEVELDGAVVQPAKTELREIAVRLGVETSNGRGNDMNTRQLGAQVIQAIRKL